MHRITVKELRKLIQTILSESFTPPRMSTFDSFSDREAISKISVSNMEKDRIAPHLEEPLEDPEDCWGPVPPDEENPHLGPDPYSKDYHVIPTPTIRR